MILDGSTWCSARRFAPWHATVQQIAKFLQDLFKKGELKVRMIEGYKLAIAATLKARGVNVGTEPHICRLISSFYTDRPVEINLVLLWDLTIVLDAFTKSTFRTAGYDFRNVSIGDIMTTCRWRSHNTFTSFYLRNFVEMEAWLLELKCFPTAASNRS